jgi:hypothetical protein
LSLSVRRLLAARGGPIKEPFFAGIPETCRMVKGQRLGVTDVFYDDGHHQTVVAVCADAGNR